MPYIPHSRHWLRSFSGDLGFWILIVSGCTDSLNCIPVTKAADSGFHKQKTTTDEQWTHLYVQNHSVDSRDTLWRILSFFFYIKDVQQARYVLYIFFNFSTDRKRLCTVEKKLNNVQSNTRATWKVENEILNRSKRNSNRRSTFKADDREITDPVKIANKFCSHFSRIGPNWEIKRVYSRQLHTVLFLMVPLHSQYSSRWDRWNCSNFSSKLSSWLRPDSNDSH